MRTRYRLAALLGTCAGAMIVFADRLIGIPADARRHALYGPPRP